MDATALAYVSADAPTRRALLARARAVQVAYRVGNGYAPRAVPLLTAPAAQAKLRKSSTPTYGLSLTPARTLPGRNLCPAASAGCVAACLNTAGKGRLGTVQHARRTRAAFLLAHPDAGGTLLAAEVLAAVARHGGRVLLRLNVVSDIRWESVLPTAMPAMVAAGARFYDYTKWRPALRAPMPGYSLTFSASERHSDADILAMLAGGHSVAIVFSATKSTVRAAAAAGALWHGAPMVDGIGTDDRTRDPRGVVVALAALGDALGDASGFVRPLAVTYGAAGVAA
jgi:hypothetical protein